MRLNRTCNIKPETHPSAFHNSSLQNQPKTNFPLRLKQIQILTITFCLSLGQAEGQGPRRRKEKDGSLFVEFEC